MVWWHRLLGHAVGYWTIPAYGTVHNRLYYCSCGKEWKWTR